MDEYKNELTGMEKEVVQLKQDIDDKTMQISHLDITLKEARSELSEKTSEGNSAVLFFRLPLIMLFCSVLALMFPHCTYYQAQEIQTMIILQIFHTCVFYVGNSIKRQTKLHWLIFKGHLQSLIIVGYTFILCEMTKQIAHRWW